MSVFRLPVLLAATVSLGSALVTDAGAQTLEIKELSIQSQSNPAFSTVSVAIENGWFEEAGFESVRVSNFVSGNAAGEAFLAGELSVWLPGNAPAITMRHNGRPVVVVGELCTARIEALMVRTDAGVASPQDLYGLKIGLVMGGTPLAVLSELAAKNGLDMAKLQLLNLAPPEDATALRNNEIQAVMAYSPNFYLMEDVAKSTFNVGEFSHTRAPIVFTEEFIRTNPLATEAIVRVLYRAQDFVISNPEEAQRIHARRAEQPIELLQKAWNDYWSPTLSHGVIDETFVADYVAYTDFLQQQGTLATDPIDPLAYTYTDILKKIMPEKVKIEGTWKP